MCGIKFHKLRHLEFIIQPVIKSCCVLLSLNFFFGFLSGGLIKEEQNGCDWIKCHWCWVTLYINENEYLSKIVDAGQRHQLTLMPIKNEKDFLFLQY